LSSSSSSKNILSFLNPQAQTAEGEDAPDFAADARRRLMEAGGVVNDIVTNRPALAVGAALAAGVFLGWLIKRR
jgi:ElaB/YqjD/DUF883 family membrane-anchored ribosome-binding protein